MTIITLEKDAGGFHLIQMQSDRTEVWEEGYISVPEELEDKVRDTGGWCDLVLDKNGNLMDVTPIQRPDSKPLVDPFEQLRSDIDYLAMEMEVDLNV